MDDSPTQSQVLMGAEIEKILGELPISYDGSVLDVGCGPLRPYSNVLIKCFAHYHGADLDAQCIEQAKAKVKDRSHVNIAQQNVECLDFQDESFDLVVCNDMLAYTNKQKALSEILRVLKPGGYCLSISNNTIDYTFYKLFHPNKPWPIEVAHSLVVLINTILFKFVRFKIFHTTFNTQTEIINLLDALTIKSKKIWIDKLIRPYRTISFIVQK